MFVLRNGVSGGANKPAVNNLQSVLKKKKKASSTVFCLAREVSVKLFVAEMSTRGLLTTVALHSCWR